MALQTPEGVFSLAAAADLSLTQYQFVQINSAVNLALCAAGARADGIQDGPAEAGDQCRYFTIPGKAMLKVRCGGTFAAGVNISSDATGRAVLSTTGAQILGKSLEAGVVGRVVAIAPGHAGVSP